MQRKIVMQAIKLIFIISQRRGPFRKYSTNIILMPKVYWRERRKKKCLGLGFRQEDDIIRKCISFQKKGDKNKKQAQPVKAITCQKA